MQNQLLACAAVVRPEELKYVGHIASSAHARVELHEWSTPELKKKLVVKKIFFIGSSSIRQKESIKKGFDLLRQIRHKNIASFHGCLQHEKNFAFVMEYCEFGSYESFFSKLWPTVQRNTELKVVLSPLKIEIISEITSAMSYLHGRKPKILHMGLKINNVLLQKNFKVKLGDVAVSNLMSSRSGANSEVLTGSAYIAPERLLDCKAQITDKQDVFAFGVLAWEILTDSKPYKEQNTTNQNMLYQYIAWDNLRPCTKKIPDFFPTRIIHLITDSWRQVPDSRPSFEELAERIDEVKSSIPSFHENVEKGKRSALLLHDRVEVGLPRVARGIRSISPNDTARHGSPPDLIRTTYDFSSLPPYNQITSPKTYGSQTTDELLRDDNSQSEESPLIPRTDVQEPVKIRRAYFAIISLLVAALSAVIIISAVIRPKTSKECPRYPSVPHGYTSCTNGLFVNSACVTTCFDNHVIKGEAKFTCEVNGTWSSPFPTCVCPDCKLGDMCQLSIYWKDVENQLQNFDTHKKVKVHYGKNNFTCKIAIFLDRVKAGKYRGYCVDYLLDVEQYCWDDLSASDAAIVAAAALIRNLTAAKLYPQACNASEMPSKCEVTLF